MRFEDHLILRRVLLKCSEVWTNGAQGFYFVFPAGGAGTFSTRSMAQPLRPGDVLVLNDCAPGQLRVADSGEMEFEWFFASLEQLVPLFTPYEICRLHEILLSLGTARFYPAVDPRASECRRLLTELPCQSSLSHRTRLLAVVAVILAQEFSHPVDQGAGPVSVEKRLDQVFEELSTSELLNLSVSELARRFSCGRRHLNRLFHQRFGFPVAALRMELRLLKSISLLRDPGSKVFNVARQCGFNSLSHFNRCFIRRFGKSPGQWREAAPLSVSVSAADHSIARCRLGSIVVCPLSGELLRSQAEPSKSALDFKPGAEMRAEKDESYRLSILPHAKERARVIPVTQAMSSTSKPRP